MTCHCDCVMDKPEFPHHDEVYCNFMPKQFIIIYKYAYEYNQRSIY